MAQGKGTNIFPDLRRHQSYSHRKFLTPEDEASIFTMDHFPLWYRQASEQPPGSFVFNLRWAEGPGNRHLSVLFPRVEKGRCGREEDPRPPALPSLLTPQLGTHLMQHTEYVPIPSQPSSSSMEQREEI